MRYRAEVSNEAEEQLSKFPRKVRIPAKPNAVSGGKPNGIPG
jgi:hypothetical protein